jgi:hypothetical protein
MTAGKSPADEAGLVLTSLDDKKLERVLQLGAVYCMQKSDF